MKRRLGLLTIAAMLVFAGGTVSNADPFAVAIPAALGHDGVELAGDKAERDGQAEVRSEAEAEIVKERRGERKLRKGFGARIWGPYWGYGPSWGRRCDNCMAECSGEDQDSARCKRCRVRCGD
jgi:hypothetical protein